MSGGDYFDRHRRMGQSLKISSAVGMVSCAMFNPAAARAKKGSKKSDTRMRNSDPGVGEERRCGARYSHSSNVILQ